jgi:hypothetical protein
VQVLNGFDGIMFVYEVWMRLSAGPRFWMALME